MQDGGSCRLIDFGVSVLLDRHPHLEAEEVYNCARTLPMFQMFSRMGATEQDIAGFVHQYRQTLARTSTLEILTRDLRFAEEGIRLAAQRMGNHIVEPLQQGFSEGYSQSQ